MPRSHKFFLALMALGLSALSLPAHAFSVQLAAYNALADDLNLSVDVTLDDGIATFEFHNDSTGASAGSSLARIYFESGLADIGLSGGTVIGGTGTAFAASYPGPAAPPAGNTVDWQGQLAAFGAGSPPPVNGINAGESLIIEFAYSGTLQALSNALTDENGNARIAVHVLDCVNGDSCAAYTVVPIPAALPLLVSGLLGLAGLARRR